MLKSTMSSDGLHLNWFSISQLNKKKNLREGMGRRFFNNFILHSIPKGI